MRRLYFLFIGLFLTISPALIAQQIEVEENINAQLEAYPQEKIHLHTDRDFYVPGEKIWFKAYVVDAHSHLHPTYSQYVYVELISTADTLVNRVMVSQTGGMFYGHLLLSNIIPEGDYTLRAYTRYMENMGDDYFFKKNIRIGNVKSESGGSRGSVQEDFDISFFPEGGNLLEDVVCKVAFKSISKNGHPETVSGFITDENGIELAAVKTYYAGMGVLTYLPVAGKKLYLKCKNPNGLEKRFELPQPDPRAYSLATSVWGKKTNIAVQKSVHAPNIPCYLLIHCKGSVLYFGEWDNRQGSVTLTEEQLPAGVVQFVLFDRQMNPLSERLIFSKNGTDTKVEFHTDKAEYEKRDKIIATLQSPSLWARAGEGLEAGEGHFSVAVTDDKDIAIDESTTILSSLLLSSELKGYIENPAYYLQDSVAMDLLMMTHGWRRYNIPEVAKGRFEKPQIPFQMFQEISGEVRTLNSRRTAPNSEIHIMMKGEGSSFGVITADRNGSFMVPELDFPDSTVFYLRALDKNGRDYNVRLFVNNESFPALVYAPQSSISTIPVTEAETKNKPDVDAFMEKAEQRAKFEEDIWALQLEEVAITAARINRIEPLLQLWANASSEITITRATIESAKLPFFHDYVALAGGIRVEEGEVSINFFLRGNKFPALVLIDGYERSYSKYNPQPSEIESIDVFKGPSAAAFGMRGANGVISITTRRGGKTGNQIENSNQVIYTPLGYQKPVEFYSPKYETLEAKRSVIPDLRTTIFWKPDVVISEDGEAFFEFYTSDYRTTYSVVIEGITADGRIVRQVEKIRVE